MTIDTRLAEIRARVDAATEGPWSVYRGDRIGTYVTRPDLAGVAREWSLTWSDADAEFIAASRTDLPALLAAVEAVDRLISPWEASEVEAHSPGAVFHAALQFAAHHVRDALTAALGAQDATTPARRTSHD